jgi:hypothetical protein
MKSSERRRKQLALDVQSELTAPLSDLPPGMIAKSALTTHSIPSLDLLAPESARNVLTGCLRRLALIPRKNAYSGAPLACGHIQAMCLASHVRPERPRLQAPNFSAIAERAAQELSPVLKANPNATSVPPVLGVPRRVRPV